MEITKFVFELPLKFKQLLLHQDDDVPIVSERGVAISPGLYSFISVESTTVCKEFLNRNLESRWVYKDNFIDQSHLAWKKNHYLEVYL